MSQEGKFTFNQCERLERKYHELRKDAMDNSEV